MTGCPRKFSTGMFKKFFCFNFFALIVRPPRSRYPQFSRQIPRCLVY